MLAFVEARIINPVSLPLRMHKIEESFRHEVQGPQALVDWPHARSILCLLHQNLRFRPRRGVLDRIRARQPGHQRADRRTDLVPHQDKENRDGGSGKHRFQSSSTLGTQEGSTPGCTRLDYCNHLLALTFQRCFKCTTINALYKVSVCIVVMDSSAIDKIPNKRTVLWKMLKISESFCRIK